MAQAKKVVFILLVLVFFSFMPFLEAQQRQQEVLSLQIDNRMTRAGGCCRVFLVNPEFTNSDQPWDERFSESHEQPEYISQHRALLLGPPGPPTESEATLEEKFNELDEAGRHFVLSAATLQVEGQAWLMLRNASAVNPQQGIIFDSTSRGSITLNINVKAGHRYDIMFYLEALGPGIFEIVNGSDQEQYQDPNNEIKNIIVSLNAASSGWAQLELNRTFGVGFILHAVEYVTTEG